MPRALVIGGSLGGLMVAHLLRSIGWDAAVFERNDEELASRGVGLGTHPQLIAILKRAGIDFDGSMGITPPRGVCLDGNGGIIIEQPMTRTLSGWSRLYRCLARCAAGGDLSVRQAAHADRTGRVAASPRFLPTAPASAATSWSAPTACARRCARNSRPTCEPVYAGYVAWRAVLDEADLPPELWRDVVDLYAFCLPDGEQFISYPVPGRDNDTAVGRRAYNIIWYRPTDAATLIDISTDAAGRTSCRRHPAAADPARRDRARSKPTPNA